MADENTTFGGEGLQLPENRNAVTLERSAEYLRNALGKDVLGPNATSQDVYKAMQEHAAKITAYGNRTSRNIEHQARTTGDFEGAKEQRAQMIAQQQEILRIYQEMGGKPSVFDPNYEKHARLEASLTRTPNVEREQGSNLRADLQVQRAKLSQGGELSEEARKALELQRTEVKGRLDSLFEDYDKATNEEDKRRIGSNVAREKNLLAELENLLEYNMRQNASAVDDVMGFLGNLAGVLSVGQVASRAFIQDPYQFRFQPAMGVLGKQGEVGALLSSALGAEEAYDVQMNQMLLTGGIGGAVGGLMQMRGATGFGSGIAGATLFTAGTAAGILGATGMGSDLLQQTGIIESPEDIISANLAEGAIDPQRMLDYYANSRAGLLQVGAGPELGFLLNGNVRTMGTGNTVLNQLSNERGLGALGYSGEQLGALLSGAATSMRGGRSELFDAVEMAGVLETGYGVNTQQTLQTMASLQRGGVSPEDMQSRMYQSMGAVAENGQISAYAQNVLVPALNQVVESMAIQNVARSNEELTEEIYGFRAILGDSETNLGRLVRSNPEAFSRLYGTMVQGVKSSLDDPARLAYNLSLGSSFTDIISGSPKVMMRQINRMMSSSYISQMDFSDPDSIHPGVLRNLSAITGIGDLQMLIGLLQLAQENGGRLSLEDVKGLQTTGEDAVEGRRNEVEDLDLTELQVELATQMNSLVSSSLSVFEQIETLQGEISAFINSDAFGDRLNNGIDIIMTETLKALGVVRGDAEANEYMEFHQILRGDWNNSYRRLDYDPSTNSVLSRDLGRDENGNWRSFSPEELISLVERGLIPQEVLDLVRRENMKDQGIEPERQQGGGVTGASMRIENGEGYDTRIVITGTRTSEYLKDMESTVATVGRELGIA